MDFFYNYMITFDYQSNTMKLILCDSFFQVFLQPKEKKKKS